MTPTTPTSGGATTDTCPSPAAPDTTASATTDLLFTLVEPSGADRCFGIRGPTSARAGWINVTLDNKGGEARQLRFLKLGNATFADFEAGRAEPAPWGGPQAGPMGRTTATLWLEPGEYVIVLSSPGAQRGEAHLTDGRVARFLVTSDASALEEPSPTLTLELGDHKFEWNQGPRAGSHVIRVVDLGAKAHEAVLAKLTGNATSRELLAAVGENATGPLPIEVLTGMATLSSTQHGYVWVDLTPGNWALVCFEQDSEEAPPHFALGMVKDFIVP